MMKSLAKKIVKKIIEPIPISAYQLLANRKLIGIFYHVVSYKPLYHVKHLYSYKSPEMFERDLIYLKKNYNLISYEKLIDYKISDIELIPNSIILTFDDGYSECFSVVRSLLLKYEVPCIFFVTTDFIDNKNMFYRNKISLCIERIRNYANSKRIEFFCDINSAFGQNIKSLKSFSRWMKTLNSFDEDIIDKTCDILGIDIKQYIKKHRLYLTSDEIKLLASDGFTIGSHGKKHSRFSLLINKNEIEKEIVNSCKKIMDLTGQNQAPFAFPDSVDSINRNFLEGLILKYKFINFFFDTQDLKKDKDFIINRIWVDHPSFRLSEKSNIPQLLRSAYQDNLIWNIRNIIEIK